MLRADPKLLEKYFQIRISQGRVWAHLVSQYGGDVVRNYAGNLTHSVDLAKHKVPRKHVKTRL